MANRSVYSSEIRSEQQEASNTTAITLSNEDDDQIFLTKLTGIQKAYEILIKQTQDVKKLEEKDQVSFVTSATEYANNIKKLDDMYKEYLPLTKLNDYCHKILDDYKTSLENLSKKVVHLDQTGLWGHSKSVKEVKKHIEQIKAYDGVIQTWINIDPIEFEKKDRTYINFASELLDIRKEYGMIIWKFNMEGAVKLREVDRDSALLLVTQFYDNVEKLFLSNMAANYPILHLSNYFKTFIENYKTKIRELFHLVAELDDMLVLLRKQKMGKKILKGTEQLQAFDLIIQSLSNIENR